MVGNVGINSVITKKLNAMDRVNEIIGHLTDEEYDAVLYGVMLRFLKKKVEEHDVDDVDDIFLSINEYHKLIETTVFYGDNHESSIRLEDIKINQA